MSTFDNLLLVQAAASIATAMPVPYSGIPGGSFETDPLFVYDPTTGTLTVPVVSFTDLFIDGDVTFSKEKTHVVSVANSTTAGVDGGDLYFIAADGAIASAIAPGGDGGIVGIISGTGGAGLAAQPGGVGGNSDLWGGVGGAGTAGALAGVGGAVLVLGGDAGADGGFGGAAGGDVGVDAGAGSGAALDGVVTIGGTNAESVSIGRVGKNTAVLGTLSVAAAIGAGTDITFAAQVNHSIDTSASTTVGQVGGRVTVSSAKGGPADAVTIGGIGGLVGIAGGLGGNGSAAQPAGVGGEADVTGGKGGTGSATALAGVGGALQLISGAGGTNGGGGGAASGAVLLDAGTPSGAANGGAISIGPTRAESVAIGRAGKLTTIVGNLKTSQGIADTDLTLAFANTGYTALITDSILLWTTTGGACSQLLPALATVRGSRFYFCKVTADANALTITPNGAETIATAASLVLGAISTACLYAPLAGTDWIVL